MIVIMLCSVKILPAVKDRCKPFQNITLNVKGFNKVQKNIAEEDPPNIKIFTG